MSSRDVHLDPPLISLSESALDSLFLDDNAITYLKNGFDISSLKSKVLVPPVDPTLQCVNTNSMVTRSKVENFKSRVLTVELHEREPRTSEEAFASKEWKMVVQEEFDALIRNHTWTLVPLPSGRKAIGCKWLSKIKRNPDGIVAHRKGRLVGQGCWQVLGVTFMKHSVPSSNRLQFTPFCPLLSPNDGHYRKLMLIISFSMGI